MLELQLASNHVFTFLWLFGLDFGPKPHTLSLVLELGSVP